MNPYAYYLILPTLSFCISIWCFFLVRKKFKARKLIYKQKKGTELENSIALIWAQIIGISILGIVMLVYTLVYVLIVLPLFFLDK